MGIEAELHDKYLASDAFWLWKEDSQGAWGLFDHDATTDAFTERPQVVAWLSRVHAARIAGDVVTNSYDHVARSLHPRDARRRQPRDLRSRRHLPVSLRRTIQ